MSNEKVAVVQSVQVGAAAPLGPKSVPSGFVKTPVSGPARIERLGIVGDVQADLSVHGGPEKAVYGYAASRYPAWLADFPEHSALLVPGAFGENLTIDGIDEDAIYVGDIHAIGSARLQVCQPRQPCFKFALRFADDRLPPAMNRNGRSGWYYRVVQAGEITSGDAIHLVDRQAAALPFARLIDIVYHRNGTAEEMTALASSDAVASWIQDWAKRWLERRES